MSGVYFLQLEASALLIQCYEKQLKGDLQSEEDSASPHTQKSGSSYFRQSCHQYPLSSCFLIIESLILSWHMAILKRTVILIFHRTKFWQKRCEQLLESVLNGNILVSKQKPFCFFQTLNIQIIRSLPNNWKSRESRNQGNYQGFSQLELTHWLVLKFAGDMPKL